MVFIITGEVESGRSRVGGLLAETLGWEFIDEANLRPPANLAPRTSNTLLADADTTLRIETLSAAINVWIYEWRDVVVSCRMLTEEDQGRLAKISSLVRIVCLEESHAVGRAAAFDRSLGIESCHLPAGSHAASTPERGVRNLDSRQVDDIIAEMTRVLMV